MKKKLISILLCTLFITAIVPVLGDNHTSVNDVSIDWWTMIRHDPQNTGFSTSEAPDENIVNWTYPLFGTNSPPIVDGKVYLNCYSEIRYLNTSNGSEAGIIPLGFHIRSVPMTVVNGKIYVSSHTAKMYCLDAIHGKEMWNYTTKYTTDFGAPIVTNGRVFFSSYSRMYCIDAQTGKEIWNYSRGGDHYSNPAVADGKIYFSKLNTKELCCLYANNGTIQWNYTVNDGPGPSGLSPPIAAEGHVYFTSSYGHVYCLNAGNGNKLWNYSQAHISSYIPAIAYNYVYAVAFNGTIYCINANNGTRKWLYTTTQTDHFGCPVVADNKVYFGTSKNNVTCLNASTGAKKWSFKMTWPADGSSIAIADGKLYIGCANGKLYCFGGSNVPPNTPLTPAGPTEGVTETQYLFATNTTDPNEQPIQYGWDWDGDLVVNEWTNFYASGETVFKPHTWITPGTYQIRVKARDTSSMNNESDWSEPLNIEIVAPPKPDLDCTGSLNWPEKLKTGSVVTGNFTVKNIGEAQSELDWEIDSYPEWGTWSFNPTSGNDLTPEEGVITVHVTIVVPDEKNTEFTGEIKIINTEDSNDFDTVEVTLKTPVNTHPFLYQLLQFLQNIIHRFPLLERLLTPFLL